MKIGNSGHLAITLIVTVVYSLAEYAKCIYACGAIYVYIHMCVYVLCKMGSYHQTTTIAEYTDGDRIHSTLKNDAGWVVFNNAYLKKYYFQNLRVFLKELNSSIRFHNHITLKSYWTWRLKWLYGDYSCDYSMVTIVQNNS